MGVRAGVDVALKVLRLSNLCQVLFDEAGKLLLQTNVGRTHF